MSKENRDKYKKKRQTKRRKVKRKKHMKIFNNSHARRNKCLEFTRPKITKKRKKEKKKRHNIHTHIGQN
jgi:hypothetical protein